MKTQNLGTKLADLCEAADITLTRFENEFKELYESDPRVVQAWLASFGDASLRDPSPQRLIEYWKNRGFVVEQRHFVMERAAFRDAFNLPPAPFQSTIPATWLGLAGVYQVIRPHAESEDAYVLEAMEVEIIGNSVTTIFVSNDNPDKKHLYIGKASPALRYFFSLMERPHEDDDKRSAFRTIAFYAGQGRFEGCISGIMTKGMRGISAGKELTGLPFIAIPMPGALSLRHIEKVPLARPTKNAEKIYLINSTDRIIAGEVFLKRYPDIFNICEKMFGDKNIKPSIRRNTLAIYAVPPIKLKEAYVIDCDEWTELVGSMSLHQD